MKRRRVLISLVLAMLVALGGSALASAQAPGPAAGTTGAPAASRQVPDRVNVKVKLTNGTPGSRVPTNVPLELFAYDGPSIVFSLQGVAGPSGEYLFEGVSYKDGRAFGVAATVGQTNYASAIEPLGPGGTQIDVPLTIYDVTTNADQLRIFQMYVLGEFVSPNEVQVTDAYLLSNAGNRTIEGGEKGADGKAATLRFDLPKGAAKVEFQADDDQSYVPTDGGFLYTRGVPPGTGSLQVAVRYTLPYSGQLHLEQAVRYPAQTVSVW